MKCEWSEAKNQVNIAKHGFDFADAHRIFELPLFAVLDEREDYGEDRWIGIGLLDERVIVVVYAPILIPPGESPCGRTCHTRGNFMSTISKPTGLG